MEIDTMKTAMGGIRNEAFRNGFNILRRKENDYVVYKKIIN